MDVLRKVLYGGYRSTDTDSETVLEGVFIPQDAHSWGKEYAGEDTRLLTPFDPPQGSCTLPEPPVSWDKEGQILFVLYEDNQRKNCNDHGLLLSSYSVFDYKSYSYLTELDTTDEYSNKEHVYKGNYLLVAEFYVDESSQGTWSFAIDSDDGSEVEIDGMVVAAYYGDHWFCGCSKCGCHSCEQCQNEHSGNIDLSEGWHRIIVRLRENGGNDGVIVWYKKPGDTNWTKFGSSTLTIRAPNIDSECRLKSEDFILTGEPASGGGVLVCKRHLFCVTSLSDGEPHRIRVLLNNSHRIWEWASKERPVCDNSLGTPAHEYFVRVKVCDPSVGLEDNCKQYPNGNYKPIGLLQKYGEGGNKVCSKSLKPCDTDADCAGEGSCIDLASIYFGLITGSYYNNLSGGVLRKNIWSINDEIDQNTGIFKTTIGDKGSIIQTINRLKTVGFKYSGYYYGSLYKCGWITTRPIRNGECRMWGNPIAEMMYEAERYFAGKKSPTRFFTYHSSQDTGLDLPKPDWEDPYEIFPWCSKPSMIVISDVNPSYDSDKVPGNDFNGYAGDLPDLKVKELAKTIGDEEGITNTLHFIGQSGSEYDFICSAKNISNLGSIRGLCPEEPTKEGSYYSAALAYYGKTQFEDKLNRQNITTYAVALSSPVPEIKIQVGSNTVTLVPIGKSVSGCAYVYYHCARRCTLTYDNNRGLVISDCDKSSYCPSNQIVDFYVTKITPTYGQFRINFEDVEQGADHDMDAIVTYEYEVIDDTHVKIKLSSDYASGCIDQVMGFVISGTSEDGVYLPVRDKDSGHCDWDTPSVVCNMPLVWEKIFTVSSGSTATLLKNPLWYAAKWGGFDDINGNNKPDLQAEWDSDGDGVPDNYFFVANPLKLYQQLDKAFKAVLNRSGSAGAVATVTQEVAGEDIVIRGAFTTYEPDDPTTYVWRGHLEVYWPIEKCLGKTTKQQCENAGCTWDSETEQCLVYSFQDPDNEGEFCSDPKFKGGHCWDAGELLQKQLQESSRYIFTYLDGEKKEFNLSN
jgi:type IV pilus assembly protein PilY1